MHYTSEQLRQRRERSQDITDKLNQSIWRDLNKAEKLTLVTGTEQEFLAFLFRPRFFIKTTKDYWRAQMVAQRTKALNMFEGI